MTVSVCAVIPSYNHHAAVEQIIVSLRENNVPVYVIDDGSGEETRRALDGLHNPEAGVNVHHRKNNGGKGAAVMTGFEIASRAGYSHVLQIDADGQHDTSKLPEFLSLAKHYPDHIITGLPSYDTLVPRGRRIARWLTHIWVWIETLSFRIQDSMCGFRVYPLDRVEPVIARTQVSRHMDFDIEILVRLFWAGTAPVNVPVNVTYPETNTSNFRPFRDNWLITKLHTRLVLTMLVCLPSILKNRPAFDHSKNHHWAAMEERGSMLGLLFLATVYRVCGKTVCRWMMEPALVYFFLSGRKQHKGVTQYLRLLRKDRGLSGEPNWREVYHQFRSFGDMALDKFAGWVGDINSINFVFDNPEMDQLIQQKKGLLVITFHIGNLELSRALSKSHDETKITVFAHTKHAKRFNDLIGRFRPEAALEVVEINDLNAGTVVDLKKKLAKGEWVIIAADRVPIEGKRRVSEINFLGEPAAFNQGPVLLAAMFRCPVYLMACMREGKSYRIYFDLLREKVSLPRREKNAAIVSLQKEIVLYLEQKCRDYPDQWYNFYDFWAKPDALANEGMESTKGE